MNRLMVYGETVVTMSVKDSHFKATEVFQGNERGFKLAFAITAYDNEEEHPEDLAKYGKMVAYKVSWGLEDSQGVKTEELDTHPCT